MVGVLFDVFEDAIPLLFGLVTDELDGVGFSLIGVCDRFVYDHWPHELASIGNVIESE